MDTNKPLLSAIFLIILSLFGVQYAQVAGTEGLHSPLAVYKTVLLDLPGAFRERALMLSIDYSWFEQVSGVLNRAKVSALNSMERAMSSFYGLGALLVQTSFLGLLGTVLEPIVGYSKTGAFKAALPGAVWFFLGGMLGVLGLKKRNSGSSVKV